MKKLIAFIFILLFLAAAGLFFGPSFVDYKTMGPKLAKVVHDKTGMTLDVKGAFKMGFLPSPHMSFKEVFLRKNGEDVFYVKDIHVKLKLMPLLKGQYILDQVVADGAILTVIRDENGMWNIAHQQEANTSNANPSEGFKVNWMSLVNAEVLYIDKASHQKEKFTGIELGMAVGSLSHGPFRIQGKATYREIPYTFRFETGVMNISSPAEFSVLLTSDRIGLTAQYSGQLQRKPTHLEHQGKAKLYTHNIKDLKDLYNLLLQSEMKIPAALEKGMELDMEVKEDGTAMTVQNLSMNWADVIHAKGGFREKDGIVSTDNMNMKLVGDTTLSYEGDVSSKGVDGKVTLASKTFWTTLDAFGIPRLLPDRLEMESGLRVGMDELAIYEMQGMSDGGKFLGDLTYKEGVRSHLEYDLSFSKFDLRGVSDNLKTAAQTVQQKLTSLRDIDADGQFDADVFIHDEGEIKGMKTKVKLDRGILKLKFDALDLLKRPVNLQADMAMVANDVNGKIKLKTKGLNKELNATSNLEINGDDFTFSDVSISWDGASFTGNGRLLRGGERPVIIASLGTSYLNKKIFKDPEAPLDDTLNTGKSVPGDQWSAKPFDLSFLRQMDLDLDITAKRFKAFDDVNLTDSKIRVNIVDKYLKELIISGKYAGGPVRTQISVDGREGVPKWHGTFSGQNIDLGKTALGKVMEKGATAITLNMKSKGTNPRSIISNLDGSGRVIGQNTYIKGFNLSVLQNGLETLQSTAAASKLFGKAFKKGTTKIAKLSIPFDVKRGIINTTGDIIAQGHAWHLKNGLAFINVLQKEMDIRGDIKILKEKTIRGDKKILMKQESQDLPTVGIRWHGKMEDPKYALRIRSLENFIKKKIWDYINKKLEKDKEKAKDKKAE